MRITDSDNALLLSQARRLAERSALLADELSNIEDKMADYRVRSHKALADGHKAKFANELWTLTQARFTTRQTLALTNRKLSDLVLRLARRTGETESRIRDLLE